MITLIFTEDGWYYHSGHRDIALKAGFSYMRGGTVELPPCDPDGIHFDQLLMCRKGIMRIFYDHTAVKFTAGEIIRATDDVLLKRVGLFAGTGT